MSNYETRLCDEYKPLIKTVVAKYASLGFDLEDLEQEALLVLVCVSRQEGPFAEPLKKRFVKKAKEALRKYRCAQRSDQIRSRRRHAKRPELGDAGIPVVSLDDSNDGMSRHETVGRVAQQEAVVECARSEAILFKIAVSVQEIFRLKAAGFSDTEIAERVGRSECAVRKAVLRARQSMREWAA